MGSDFSTSSLANTFFLNLFGLGSNNLLAAQYKAGL